MPSPPRSNLGKKSYRTNYQSRRRAQTTPESNQSRSQDQRTRQAESRSERQAANRQVTYSFSTFFVLHYYRLFSIKLDQIFLKIS